MSVQQHAKQYLEEQLAGITAGNELTVTPVMATGVFINNGFCVGFPHFEVVLKGELPISFSESGRVVEKTLYPGDAIYLKPGAYVGRDNSTKRNLLVINCHRDGIECYRSHHQANTTYEKSQRQRICYYLPTPLNAGGQQLIANLEWFIKAGEQEVQTRLFKTILTVVKSQFAAETVDTVSRAQLTFKMIMQYLKENCRNIQDRQAVSDEFGLSADYISHLFQEYHHDSFHNTLILLKMNEAGRLLTESSMTVKEIALELGYPETSYFIKVFRRVYHMTPGQFRTNHAL